MRGSAAFVTIGAMNRQIEADTLAELGAVLHTADLPDVEVRLPRELADRAVRAWERRDEGQLGTETGAERDTRHRAGTLALIGLLISEYSFPEGDNIVVTLPVEFIGAAIVAAEG
jgi:hypothetical protein